MKPVVPWITGCVLICCIGGCASGVPKSELQLSPQSFEQRQLQTRRFETTDEGKLLAASAGLLQDLGFNIDASQSGLGLLVASKNRDATDGGQVVGAVAMAVLFGVSTPIDREQKIRVSVVTRPEGGRMAVRVTFQRMIWNTNGQVSRLEFIDDPSIYQRFYEGLSKAIFLEAHNI